MKKITLTTGVVPYIIPYTYRPQVVIHRGCIWPVKIGFQQSLMICFIPLSSYTYLYYIT